VKWDASRGSDKASPSTSRGKALLRYVADLFTRIYKNYSEPPVIPPRFTISLTDIEEHLCAVRRRMAAVLRQSDTEFLRSMHIEPWNANGDYRKVALRCISEFKEAQFELTRHRCQAGVLSCSEAIAAHRRLKTEVKEYRRLAGDLSRL
jgi:hypothetical protein